MPGCADTARRLFSGSPAPAKVSLVVMQQRRDICRECPHATRNPERVERSTKGLTSKSVCEMAGPKANIGNGTQRVDRRCPLGKW
jgi:hypothetical protein